MALVHNAYVGQSLCCRSVITFRIINKMAYNNYGGNQSSGGRRSANHSNEDRSYQSRQRFNRNSNYSNNRFSADADNNDNIQHRHTRPSFNSYSQEFNSASRPDYNRRRQNYSPEAGRDFANTRRRDNSSFRQTDRTDGQQQYSRPRFNNKVYSQRKQQEYRQRYEDPNKEIRLNKFLANAGICSRREADDFIQAGVITVNGQIIDSLGAKVKPTDEVKFHDQPVRRERKVYILLNKPKNCVTTTDDPQERKTVLDIVKNACSERIYPVGRLDRNTTGVLLLTNDGDLAARLTHPKFGKKKIYAAVLDKDLEEEDFRAIMQGVTLDDELIVPDALEFTTDEDRRHLGLEIHSGQNRVVRRIFEKVGYKVMQLDRVSFAGLTKKNVSRGKYRFLTPKEVSMLQMGAFE